MDLNQLLFNIEQQTSKSAIIALVSCFTVLVTIAFAVVLFICCVLAKRNHKRRQHVK